MRKLREYFIALIVILLFVVGGIVSYNTLLEKYTIYLITNSNPITINKVPSSEEEKEINNIVLSFLKDSRDVITFKDVERVMSKYYSKSALGQKDENIKNDITVDLKQIYISNAQNMPDPEKVKYVSIGVNNDLATAVYLVDERIPLYQAGVGGPSMYNYYLDLIFKKEDKQWRIDKFSFQVRY